MENENKKMVEGLKKLKDAIENFVDNMTLDEADEKSKPKKKAVKEEKDEKEKEED
jgi:hypothetical protein